MNINIFSFTLALFISFSAHAGPQIEHWQTGNGAQVYFVSAPELPMLDIDILFDAGSVRDGSLSGMAMMTNAMLNEGAGGLNPDEIAAEFENVGAQFSHSSQRDMAMISLRSLTAEEQLKPALKMFNSVLTQAEFPHTSFERLHKQMKLGLQAEKQSPGAIAARTFNTHLYGNHPYSAMPAGDEQSVDKLSLASLKAFKRQYYVAKNSVIILVGAINKQQAVRIANQVVDNLPSGNKAIKLLKVEPISEAKKIVIEHPSSQTHILMGQLGIKRGDADYFPLYVGNHILGGSGLVSQLSNEIREKRGLSYSVYSYFRPMRELGPYQFGLQTRNEQADEALGVLQDTLASFIENGVTEKELLAAKQNITGGFALRLDSNSKIAGYLAMIGFYGLPLDYLDTFKQKVDLVTVKQIKEAYMRRVQADNMITVMVGGKK